MMYPYMTLPDDTEITHSDIINNNGKEQVQVYIETPIDGGFKDATCILPDYEWTVHGYTEEEMKSATEDEVEKAKQKAAKAVDEAASIARKSLGL